MAQIVADVMSEDLLTVAGDCRLGVVRQMMTEGGVNLVPVTEGDAHVLGTVSSATLAQVQGDDQAVSEVMLTHWCECAPTDRLDQLAQRMRDEHAHHALVVTDERLVGVVSSIDLLSEAARPPQRRLPDQERRKRVVQVLAVGCSRRLLEEACDSRYTVQWADRLTDQAAEIEAQAFDLLVVSARAPHAFDDVANVRATLTPEQLPILMFADAASETALIRAHAAGATDTVGFGASPEVLRARLTLLLACFKRNAIGQRTALPGGSDRAFGRYRIEDELGSGGYGVVYRAFDCERGSRVALKVLFAGACQQHEVRFRFLREFYALSTVSSPFVAQALDAGLKEGRPYLAMELVQGPSLEDAVLASGPFDELAVLDLIEGITRALEALFRSSLLHRDVKPANVILRGGKAKRPVLVDLGLAKRSDDSSVTGADVIVGTPSYLSPERIRGEGEGITSDLYALGLVARYALVGHGVYPKLRGWKLIEAMTRPLPEVRGVSPAMGELLGLLTAHTPSARLQNTKAVLGGVRRARLSLSSGS